MSTYEDRFSDHNVHNVLSQVEETVKESPPENANSDALDNLDRLKQAAGFIRSRLEIASPSLTPTSRLDQIQKSLQSALNEINQFYSNGNAGHLANASNQIETGLNAAAIVITLEQPVPSVRAADAIGFKSLAENAISELRDQAASATEVVKELTQTVDSLDARADEQKKALERINLSIDAKFQELESQFQAEQTDRQSTFDATLEQLKDRAEQQLTSEAESAKEILNHISTKQSEAERMVSLIGNIGLTGNFKGAASREKEAADWLRIVALGCFLAMVVVVLVTLFISVENGFDPWLALFRLGAGLTLVVPAAYAARESSKHRTLENKNRRAELELASIDAYLDNLPKEKREEIKAQLTDKFFGQIPHDEKNDTVVEADSLVGLLKEAISALGKK